MQAKSSLDRTEDKRAETPAHLFQRPQPGATGEQSSATGMKETLERVRSTAEESLAARHGFEHEYLAGVNDVSRALREVAADERFREAVAWQNRNVLHAGVDSLLRHNSPNASRDSKQRQNEEAVASYWQRYRVK